MIFLLVVLVINSTYMITVPFITFPSTWLIVNATTSSLIGAATPIYAFVPAVLEFAYA